MKNSTKVVTWFQVSCNEHSWLGPTDYSQYYKRLTMSRNGELPIGEEVYGIPQCIEHIAEYYGRQDEYTANRQKDVLAIELVTKTIEQIDFTPIDPIINERGKKITVAETD